MDPNLIKRLRTAQALMVEVRLAMDRAETTGPARDAVDIARKAVGAAIEAAKLQLLESRRLGRDAR